MPLTVRTNPERSPLMAGPQPASSTDAKISTLGTRIIQLIVGLSRSRILGTLAIAGIAAVAIIYIPGALDSAVILTGVGEISAIGLLAIYRSELIKKHKFQKTGFELVALWRLLRNLYGKKNYEEIFLDKATKTPVVPHNPVDPTKGHVFLGALPNALSNNLAKLKKEGVSTVISLNEDFELKPLGLSIPYSAEDYARAGITYVHVDAMDHEDVDPEKLYIVAQAIINGLKNGNVYVHCRAGHGRSAMGVAASFVPLLWSKWCRANGIDPTTTNPISIKRFNAKIAQIIHASRKKSSIEKKNEGLNAFFTYLHRRPPEEQQNIKKKIDALLSDSTLPPPFLWRPR